MYMIRVIPAFKQTEQKKQKWETKKDR